MKQKENWIEERMNAEAFVQAQVPSEALMQRLKRIPEQIAAGYDKVPKRVVWTIAASIAVLICLNFISLTNYDSTADQTEQVDPYFSYLKQL